MYVVPTPFALAAGTVGLSTLIVPSEFVPQSRDLMPVGELTRVEADELVVSYEFDLLTNKMTRHLAPNPRAGIAHRFRAYRRKGEGEQQRVTLTPATVEEPADDR